MRVERPGTRAGYDIWAETYDATPNPVVRLDERVTPGIVRARAGERILDAGCGTGRYFPALRAAGAEVVGIDFSLGMLRVARQQFPDVPLAQADLQRTWPFRDGAFDAVLCALVGEHLGDLPPVFGEMRRVLRPSGRAVFSVYHPAMAEAGKEANFVTQGTEYRLGAVRHSVRDYHDALAQAGFTGIVPAELLGDEALARDVPSARKYAGFPMLVVFSAER